MDIIDQPYINQHSEYNFKCPKHLNKNIEWIKLVEGSDPYALKCTKCLDKTEFENCIYIEDLLDSDYETIFEGWPFSQEPEILERLKEITSKASEPIEIKEKIRIIFKNIRMKIDSKLEEKQEEIFQFIDQCNKAQEEYNQICQKEKLIDIVKSMNQDFEKKNQMLKEIIKENNLNYEINKQNLLNQINNFNKIINLDLDVYSRVENKLCDVIENENWQLKIFDQQQDILNQNNMSSFNYPDNLSINQNDVDINLSQSLINTDEATRIRRTLENNPNITRFSLNLSKSQISADGFKGVCCCLEKCQNIRYLKLDLQEISVNQFNTESNVLLGENIFNYNQYCQFWLSISNSIAEILQKLPNITELDLNLSQNEIGPEGLKKILSALQKCRNITSLNLNLSNLFLQLQTSSFTQRFMTLGSNEVQVLATTLDAFKIFQSLNLNLSKNQIDDDGINCISNSLLKCISIENLDLDMSFNNCNQEIANDVMESLLFCQNILNSKINLQQSLDFIGQFKVYLLFKFQSNLFHRFN
ncbi:kinase domain protein (macronuclear) [Tetrahymena thermophila SB210]|uniref:Kinase domain protein n=1 Tax=Tetrahymena thermophila (strain SB210) TaxID=312017 RepID=W7XDH6_TETTS|nr:kinase domain protein [Tetrahymena thermophila SB210]EWS75617.1 kinase domain protein [Tetrahymena thermophila SB210]|eukprot:XP_012651836.1 kinase domain protein [Tetrahymena thermophila SB210]